MDVDFKSQGSIRSALYHTMLRQPQWTMVEMTDNWEELLMVEGMVSVIPGACVSYLEFSD